MLPLDVHKMIIKDELSTLEDMAALAQDMLYVNKANKTSHRAPWSPPSHPTPRLTLWRFLSMQSCPPSEDFCMVAAEEVGDGVV